MTDGNPQKAYRTRLWVLFARNVRKAVILRRGPRRHFHLINWNLDDDTFAHGQWMKGFVRLWDLSPDGEKLIYWAHQYHASAPRHQRRFTGHASADRGNYDPLEAERQRRSPSKRQRRRKIPRYMREHASTVHKPRPRRNEGVWTAISRPPYFSALAIWPSFGHWTGGGVFINDTTIILNEDREGIVPQENVPLPKRISVHEGIPAGPEGTWPRFSARHGWQTDGVTVTAVSEGLFAAGAVSIEWIAPDHRGDLLFACDGCLYRLKKWRDVHPENYLSAAEQLADFRNLTFELVPPPTTALEW